MLRTGQLSFGSRQLSIGGCHAGEPDALVQILRGFCRRGLDSRCTRLSNGLVQSQSRLDIAGEAVLVGEDDTESCSVFDCLASALRLVRHHRMSRVAQDASLPLEPVLNNNESHPNLENQGNAYIIWLVDVEAPRHALDGMLQQGNAIRVERIVSALDNIVYGHLLEGKTWIALSKPDPRRNSD